MEQSTYKDQEVVNKVFVKGRVATISDVNGTVLFTVVSKNGNRTIFVKMSCKKSVMPQIFIRCVQCSTVYLREKS